MLSSVHDPFGFDLQSLFRLAVQQYYWNNSFVSACLANAVVDKTARVTIHVVLGTLYSGQVIVARFTVKPCYLRLPFGTFQAFQAFQGFRGK